MNVSGVSSNYLAYGLSRQAGVGQSAAQNGASQGLDQMAQQLFAQMDADGDGSVTESEMKAGLQKMGPPPGPPPMMMSGASETTGASATDGSSSADSLASELFAQADTDGDGSVTEADLKAAMGKMHSHHHQHGAAGASASSSETSGAAFDPSAMISDIFSQADADGDGSITQAELKAALEQMGLSAGTNGSSQDTSAAGTDWLSAQGLGAYQDSLMQYAALSAAYGSQQGFSVTA